MYRNLLIIFCLGVTFFVVEGSSLAEPLKKRDYHCNQNKAWSVRIGLMGICNPEYEGSDDYEVSGSPFVNITWRDTFFLYSRKGLGAYVWNRNDVKLGASIGMTSGRDEDNSSELDGLGDIDGGAKVNVLFEWTAGDFTLDADYEQQITGEDTGFQIHLVLGYDLMIMKKFMLKSSIKTTYASSDYMEEYFGISPIQSARSGLVTYDVDSGFKSVGFQIMTTYRLKKHWGIQAMAGYDRLVGDAADSPVVENVNQYLLGVGLSYKF